MDSLSESLSESPSESPSSSTPESFSESPSESASLSPSASESPSESLSESPSLSPSNSPSDSPSESPSAEPENIDFNTVEVIKVCLTNKFFIDWSVDIESPAVIDDFKFRIYWSFDPVDGFESILDSNDDIVEIDGAVGPLEYTHDLTQYNFNKDRYYKVLAIEKADELHQLFSQTVYVGMFNDGVHEVMRHNENILYSHYYGEPCYIIKRKSTGTRCPDCWSSTRRQRTKSHCDTCNGTGFVNGYYEPIPIQISFDSDPRKSDSQKDFENVFDDKIARLSNYPLVRPKDMIVNRDDAKRYVITHVETTKLPKLRDGISTLSKQNYILSQILNLNELNPDDNEYRVTWLDDDPSGTQPTSEEVPTGFEFDVVDVLKVPVSNNFYIEWTVDIEAPDVVDDYEFKIYWSFDPVSDFETIKDSGGNDIVIDGAIGPLSYTHDHEQYNFNKDRYYKILSIEKLNPGNTIFSETVYIGMYKDGFHNVMKYNEETLYSTYHGEPCKIMKRKSTGTRCPDCWSDTRRQRIISHCDTCNGTGLVDGYYDAITVQMSLDSDPKKADSQKEWENIFDTKRGRISNYPLVRPKDIVVNCDDAKRYVVTNVQTTKLPRLSTDVNNLSRQNYVLSQLLTLEELNPDDNEYRVI